MAAARSQSWPLGHNLSGLTPASAETLAERINWLSFHRIWGQLGAASLQAIAQALQLLTVDPDTHLYQQEQTAIGLYILQWGAVEIYRPSSVGRTHICYRSAGDVLGYAPLLMASDQATYQTSAIALTASAIWFLQQADFERLVRTHPDIQIPINRLLTQDLAQFTQRIAWEEMRIQKLQDYIRPVPSEGSLMSQSKAAQKLAQQVDEAARGLAPIFLQAAPGTGKTFVAGYIHGQSGLKQQPFAEIDCAQLPRDESGQVQSDRLFGTAAGPVLGVLELLERGTLLIDNVQLLTLGDRDRLTTYLQTGTFTRNPAPVGGDRADASGPTAPPTVKSWVRLMLASPHKPSVSGVQGPIIKLFSLAQRKDDIPHFAQHFLEKFCREQRRPTLQLDQGDRRRLISYAYPGNLGELAGILQRTVIMTPPDQSVIPEPVLWSVQSEKNAFRIDLLNQLPWLRQFLLSPWWPERFWIVVMGLFIPVTVMGFIGPQTRDANMALNFFWAWWWPGYLFLFAFVGRLWCAVCPFMITGEWLRRLSLWLWPRELLPWPTQWLNRWGAWYLFAGFVAIYLWEHLWDLPHTAYLSAWLLLVITAGAVIGSLIYERRLWCRYLCPIGGMNGMFAKLSMVEVRSAQQVCGSQCQTFGCYKGSPATPVTFTQALPTEGQATGGCPLYSHPAQLPDNRDCVLCMTCLKACPNRSVQVNLRFPASDLLENHRQSWAEAALLLLLLGGVFMHHDHQILGWLGQGNWPVDAAHLLLGTPVVIGLLGAPALLTYGAHQVARLGDREMPGYLIAVYAYLPLTLAANLAHYIPAAMTEAGQILPVMARTFGFSGQGFPTLTWSPDVAAFLQGVTLLSGVVFSVYPLLRTTHRPWLSNLPHLMLIAGLTVMFFKLMV
ncbi:MAG: cyclic nucleotide-binding domain-containing protein [Leptolyngbya sp. SIOISBB]|nr:cyclic nucleotide-binding domain-containing protein [Leptolyngbya sp. SIOISBB]